ncbi:MAG: glucosaminidase domain-containing protein [Saprospiraceae bacterium]|nr:glucosaminidase domain-containing protein [Saprospiraceae bacterium]MCB0622406.1 glucosaminidase domain-containing protein [Saprospiraceae bacterium]MCB0677310.1 glucosaminidase domain-containing protein [Saprospiraceae bacterium]MCB0681348.1 glucosaminidase domain-containing protein [Saprospiraceae bacterium]
MGKNKPTFRPKEFVRHNWFKLLFVGLALYVFFQKDLSFQINLRSPGPDRPAEEPLYPKAEPTEKREKLSDARADQSIRAGHQAGGVRELLEITSFLGGARKTGSLQAALEKIDEETQIAYLRRFAHVAISERKKYGIPSSIILANALLHSVAGKRDLAIEGDNHFGLECGEYWEGGRKNTEGICFRQYDNAWSSFRDHSHFITTGAYESLRLFDSTDYKHWAEGLEELNYSEEPELANTLIELIEYFRLYELDTK